MNCDNAHCSLRYIPEDKYLLDDIEHGYICSITDQGTNFQSQLLYDIYQTLDINRLRTSQYHPQTDGITERFNNTVKTMLAAYLEDNKNKWDEHLAKLTFAYNSAKHTTTGYTPYEIMFGRKPKVQIDYFYTDSDNINHNDNNESFEKRVSDYALELQNRLKNMFEIVKNNRDVIMNKAVIRHDRTTR